MCSPWCIVLNQVTSWIATVQATVVVVYMSSWWLENLSLYFLFYSGAIRQWSTLSPVGCWQLYVTKACSWLWVKLSSSLVLTVLRHGLALSGKPMLAKWQWWPDLISLSKDSETAKRRLRYIYVWCVGVLVIMYFVSHGNGIMSYE